MVELPWGVPMLTIKLTMLKSPMVHVLVSFTSFSFLILCRCCCVCFVFHNSANKPHYLRHFRVGVCSMIFFPNPSWLPLAFIMLHPGTLTARLPVKIGRVPNGKDRLPTIIFQQLCWIWGVYFLFLFYLQTSRKSSPFWIARVLFSWWLFADPTVRFITLNHHLGIFSFFSNHLKQMQDYYDINNCFNTGFDKEGQQKQLWKKRNNINHDRSIFPQHAPQRRRVK